MTDITAASINGTFGAVRCPRPFRKLPTDLNRASVLGGAHTSMAACVRPAGANSTTALADLTVERSQADCLARGGGAEPVPANLNAGTEGPELYFCPVRMQYDRRYGRQDAAQGHG